MTVLLDNSIVSGAELAEPATMEETVLWGNISLAIKVHGYKKRVSRANPRQEEIDALVTIGRLIREGAVSAYTYSELSFELFRRSTPVKAFYALDGCRIHTCPAPIERSKFRQTADLRMYASKGGKEDKKASIDVSDFNQIAFIKSLLCLDDHSIQAILKHATELGLTEFEVESFGQIEWLRFISSRLNSAENYPDAFHLWTAERNNIDVFLTLEERLPNAVDQIRRSKNHKHQVRTLVLRPIAFLRSMGISKPDDPPIKAGQFYRFLDVL